MGEIEDESAAPDYFRVGWEEWVSLPDLGLPAMRAKVDTGARTSALHAFDIEPFGPEDAPRVRFGIHPIPGRDDVSIPCSAQVLDRREVTLSNGEMELRYVIGTVISVGGRTWPIEVTLTDRGSMAYRMLLGRQALAEDIVVVPGERRFQPELSYDVYHTGAVAEAAPRRSLRVAVLSREARTYTTRRLVDEGQARGHVVEVIDTTRCYMAINAEAPDVHYDGRRLPRYDVVIPRIGASTTAYGAAVIRQFETIGTFVVNPAEGILASRDKLWAHQVLARHRIGMPETAFAASPQDTDNLIGLVGTAPLVVKLLQGSAGQGVVLAETRKAAVAVIAAFRGLKANFLVQHFVKEAAGETIRCLVIGGRVVAAVKRAAPEGVRRVQGPEVTAVKVRLRRAEREAAVKAARALKLRLAAVDLLRAADGPKVVEVNATPGFEGLEPVVGGNLAGLLYDEIEKRVRPHPARRRAVAAARD